MSTETVKHSEFLAAIDPLLALCGTDAHHVLADIHITRADDGDSLIRMELLRTSDPGDGTEPIEHGDVYAWPLAVEVLR